MHIQIIIFNLSYNNVYIYLNIFYNIIFIISFCSYTLYICGHNAYATSYYNFNAPMLSVLFHSKRPPGLPFPCPCPV